MIGASREMSRSIIDKVIDEEPRFARSSRAWVPRWTSGGPLWADAEADALGDGGIAIVTRATRLSRHHSRGPR
jgi:hypothetical protein